HSDDRVNPPKPDREPVARAVKEEPAKEKDVQKVIGFRKLNLNADDIADVTGVNIYKFKVNIAKGQKFRVLIREFNEKGAEPRILFRHGGFRNQTKEETVVGISFTRRDGKFEGVLLYQEKDALFRFNCEGCCPGGIATFVPIPLADVPGTEKLLYVA